MVDIEKKSDGVIGALSLLLTIRQAMDPVEFEMFCEKVPDGEAFWIQFMKYRDGAKDPSAYDALSFVRDIMKEHLLDYFSPRSCKLPPESRPFVVQVNARRLTTLGAATLLAAHREERPALDQMREILCRGCGQSGCIHRYK